MPVTKTPATDSKPRRRFFQEPGDQADSSAAAVAPEQPVTASAPVKQRPGPKPKQEAATRVVWGYRARREHKKGVEAMLKTAPRHINLQDLMDYIMADFLSRNPTLPEALRTSEPPA